MAPLRSQFEHTRGHKVVAPNTVGVTIGTPERHHIAGPPGTRAHAILPIDPLWYRGAIWNSSARLNVDNDVYIAQELQEVGRGLRLHAQITAAGKGAIGGTSAINVILPCPRRHLPVALAVNQAPIRGDIKTALRRMTIVFLHEAADTLFGVVDARIYREPHVVISGGAHPLHVFQAGLDRIEVVEF